MIIYRFIKYLYLNIKYTKLLRKVYKDENNNKVELRDWRLPTEAELKIIMELQGTDNNAEAIDFLLNAGYYVAANGSIKNTKVSSTSTTAGRCVRDAYEK